MASGVKAGGPYTPALLLSCRNWWLHFLSDLCSSGSCAGMAQSLARPCPWLPPVGSTAGVCQPTALPCSKGSVLLLDSRATFSGLALSPCSGRPNLAAVTGKHHSPASKLQTKKQLCLSSHLPFRSLRNVGWDEPRANFPENRPRGREWCAGLSGSPSEEDRF